MTYRNSSSSSCFERLEFDVPFSDTHSFGQSISVTDVKQAYRRLALKTHPDKVPMNQKEQASAHFRELHEAYEEALSVILNHESDRDNDSNSNTDRDSGSDKYSQSGFDFDHDSNNDDEENKQEGKYKNTKSYYASDDDIKKAFEDFSKDLDSAYEKKCQKAEEKCFRCVEAAWASNEKEKSWTLISSISLDFMIPDLAKDFEARSDKLSGLTVYVEERATQVEDEPTISLNKRIKEVVERINREWPHRAASLKEWMMEKVCVLSFDEIATLVQDPNAARSILVWEKEKCEEMDRSVAIHQQEIADQIVKVFPDKMKMECIIEKHDLHFELLRNPIYKLLPEHIRRTLTTVLLVCE